jgi:hypothetical protein
VSTKLLWIRDGDEIPKGTRLLRVHQTEIRWDYGATTSTRWILCELEVLSREKP